MSVFALAHAQSIPALINYQGQIQNPDGTLPPTADYTVTFNIYDAATGGTLIWGPQIFDGQAGAGHGPRIPVVQGYFNVMLGPMDTASRSLAEGFSAATRYAEIKMANNAPISPRQQFLASPFAFKASSAEKLVVAGGSSTSAVAVDGSGNVGIGTAAPQAKLEVSGGDAAVGANSQFLARYQNGSTAYAGSFGWNWLQLGNNGANYVIAGRSTPGGYFSFVTDNTNDYRYGNQPSGITAMTLSRIGNLGIGTTGPSERLHVAGSIMTEGTGGAGRLVMKSTANGGHQYEWYPDTPTVGDFSLFDRTSGTTPLVVTSAGNVGVGVDPQAKLDVGGTVMATTFQGDGIVPPGCIVAFGGGTPPSGWLLCDGSAYSRAVYGACFTVIGTAWGGGDGVNTFNVPDLRGYFLRGTDTLGGRDPDRASRTNRSGEIVGSVVGSFQSDAMMSHTHNYTSPAIDASNWGVKGDTFIFDATETRTYPTPNAGVSTATPLNSAETGPKNAYVNYIIKY